MRRLWSTVFIAALGVNGLVGCSEEEQRMLVWDAVATSLGSTSHEVSVNAELYIQDASPRVGAEATYRGGPESDAWIIVAACADQVVIAEATEVEFAVIPEATMTDEVRQEIEDGDFLNAVWCEGRPYRA